MLLLWPDLGHFKSDFERIKSKIGSKQDHYLSYIEFSSESPSNRKKELFEKYHGAVEIAYNNQNRIPFSPFDILDI